MSRRGRRLARRPAELPRNLPRCYPAVLRRALLLSHFLEYREGVSKTQDVIVCLRDVLDAAAAAAAVARLRQIQMLRLSSTLYLRRRDDPCERSADRPSRQGRGVVRGSDPFLRLDEPVDQTTDVAAEAALGGVQTRVNFDLTHSKRLVEDVHLCTVYQSRR